MIVGMTTPRIDATAVANTTRVALYLADALAEAHCDADSAEAALSDATWRLAVAVAKGEHPEWSPPAGYLPSSATRAATVTVLRQRETVADPFAGFPRPVT